MSPFPAWPNRRRVVERLVRTHENYVAIQLCKLLAGKETALPVV